MPTDDERREVARSLREIPDSMTYSADRIGKTVLEMFSPNGVFHGNGRRAFNRLADLIEPDTTTDTTKSPEFTTKCDRDALLALADRIQHHADNAAGHSAYAARFDLAGWAEVIREALGVDDD